MLITPMWCDFSRATAPGTLGNADMNPTLSFGLKHVKYDTMFRLSPLPSVTPWETSCGLQPAEAPCMNSRRMMETEALFLCCYSMERFLIYCWWKVSIVPSNKNLWSHMGAKSFFFQLLKKLVTKISSLFELWVWSISSYPCRQVSIWAVT